MIHLYWRWIIKEQIAFVTTLLVIALSQIECIPSMQSKLFVTKTVLVVAKSYPHRDSYKPCWWLWQCENRVKWKFTYVPYIAKRRVPIMRALMMTSQKGRWQMFAGFSEHHQINPPTMAKPTACSYICWPIHQKECRGVANALRSGTRRMSTDMFDVTLSKIGVWQ